MAVRALAWLGVATTALDDLSDFFQELLGSGPESRDAAHTHFVLSRSEDVELFGPGNRWFEFYDREARGPVPGLVADDLDAVLAASRLAGGQEVGERTVFEGAEWVHVRAPDGNLYQLARAVKTPVPQPRLVWLGAGAGSSSAAAMVSFVRDGLGLVPAFEQPGTIGLTMGDGALFEIFTEEDPAYPHFTGGPVAGFRVEDVEAGRSAIVSAGGEPLGGAEHGDTSDWQHFRAPDGNVYEVTVIHDD